MKYGEPLPAKIQRFLFQAENEIEPTISEQLIQDVNKSILFHNEKIQIPETIKQFLVKSYYELSNIYEFGVSHKLMANIFKQMGLITNQFDKQSFYQRSGYYKNWNSKPASFNLRAFLLLIQEYFVIAKKQQKCDSYIEFLHIFQNIITNNEPKIKQWETKFLKIKHEYEKAFYFFQDKKKTLINYLLITNPQITQQEIDSIIFERGLKGLSLQEKVEVANKQYALFFTLRKYYEDKLQNQALSMKKLGKYKRQMALFDKKLKNLEEIRKDDYQKFKILFKQ